MPHAMTEAFMVDETPTGAPVAAPRVSPARVPARQHESETPNERAMRKATAARRTSEPHKRQQA
jgi:hypothetical protein